MLAAALDATAGAGNHQRMLSGRALRVVLVEDHDLYREGLKSMLRHEGFLVVGEAGSGEQGVALALHAKPDVVVMDLELGDISGAEATRRIIAKAPDANILVLTVSTETPDVFDAILAGARGYLLKGSALDEIVAGIHAASEGEASLSSPVATELLRYVRESLQPLGRRRDVAISDRERDVLRLLVQGKDNAEIARVLFLRPTTVKHHVSSILEKLGVENRLQAAVLAVREGLV